LGTPNKGELSFNFNASTVNGNILCTKDDTLALNVELVNSVLIVNVREIRTKRILQTVKCLANSQESLNKLKIIKKGVNQVSLFILKYNFET
jgi:hypothetical protein